MRKPTAKQKEVVEVIIKYKKEHGYPPAIRELGELVNVRSSSTAKGYLDRLKEGGYVTWQEGRPRTLKVLDKGRELIAAD